MEGVVVGPSGQRAFLFGYPHAISLIRPENVPSQAVARKLGTVAERKTIFAGMEHCVFKVARGTAP